MQQVLQWLTLTPQQQGRLDEVLAGLERTERQANKALATQLRDGLRRRGSQRPQVSAVALPAGGGPREVTLVDRLVEVFVDEHTASGACDVCEFLNRFYRRFPQATNDMKAPEGGGTMVFLKESCDGRFVLIKQGDGQSKIRLSTKHELQQQQSRLSKRWQETVQSLPKLWKRLVTVFWRCFGTRSAMSKSFFQALITHDAAAKDLMVPKAMAYLRNNCQYQFAITDLGRGSFKIKLRANIAGDARLCDPALELMDDPQAGKAPAAPAAPDRSGLQDVAKAVVEPQQSIADSQQAAGSANGGPVVRSAKQEPDELRPQQVWSQPQHHLTLPHARSTAAADAATAAVVAKRLAQHRAAKFTVDLTADDDDDDVDVVSPVPQGAAVGWVEPEPPVPMCTDSTQLASWAATTHAAPPAVDAARDPRRRRDPAPAAAAAAPQSVPMPELGPEPKLPAFKLLLYNKRDDTSIFELSWICLEQGLKYPFRVPNKLVAHRDQVIPHHRFVNELAELPSCRIWSSGPRGDREWPKLCSHLLGGESEASHGESRKVVVCSPGLADRLKLASVAGEVYAQAFPGHYYLSNKRLYWAANGAPHKRLLDLMKTK